MCHRHTVNCCACCNILVSVCMRTFCKMSFLMVATILLSVAGSTHGSLFDNVTNVKELFENSTEILIEPTSEVPTLWCPKGLTPRYFCSNQKILDLPSDNSTSCVNVLSKEPSIGWESKCENFFADFMSCEKSILQSEFKVDITGKGIIDDNGIQYPLGMFYIDVNNNAIVCGETPASCKPLPSELLADSRVNEDGSLLIANLSIVLDDSRYFVKQSDGEYLEQVCLPLSKDFTECQDKILLTLGKEAWIQKNWSLLTDINEMIPFDTYILLEDRHQVAYCLPTQPSTAVAHVYAAATIVSVFFLLLTLVLHQLVPVINTKDKSLLCHMLSLMFAYTALIVTHYGFPADGKTQHNPAACTIVYIFFHIFILAAFLWLNVTAFQLWRIFRKLGCSMPTKKSNTTFILSCLYAFGIPVVVCAITLAINWSENLQNSLGMRPQVNTMCSISKGRAMLVLLYAPMSAILLVNMVFFGLTVYNLLKAGSGAKLVNKDIYKQLLHVAIKLFFVMGLCWIMEVVSFFVGGDEAHWYLTDTINGLQGVFIFIVYVCKRSTFEAIRGRYFPEARKKSASEKTSSTSENSNETKLGGVKLQNVIKIQNE